MTDTPNSWTIAAARDALRKREITAVDLTMACLTAMDAGDGLNAFVHKTPEIALEQARAADARLAAGDAPAMCGIPLGVKDPVSYTHLDVYKRQANTCAFCSSSGKVR